MIARKAPSGKERGRRSSSRLGAVRLRACDDSAAAGELIRRSIGAPVDTPITTNLTQIFPLQRLLLVLQAVRARPWQQRTALRCGPCLGLPHPELCSGRSHTDHSALSQAQEGGNSHSLVLKAPDRIPLQDAGVQSA